MLIRQPDGSIREHIHADELAVTEQWPLYSDKLKMDDYFAKRALRIKQAHRQPWHPAPAKP